MGTRASPPTTRTLDLQRDALTEAGCERIFEDTAGGTAERPSLEQALSHLRSGDTLVVWRLDRLGRSLKDLISRAEALRTGGVGLKSLKEAIETDSPTGQLVFHIFGALAEFKRSPDPRTDPGGPTGGPRTRATWRTEEAPQRPAAKARSGAVPITPAHGEGDLLAHGDFASKRSTPTSRNCPSRREIVTYRRSTDAEFGDVGLAGCSSLRRGHEPGIRLVA